MHNLFSGSFGSLSWLLNYSKDVSLLICLIFFIRFFAGKKLPAWWSYSLWIVLVARMLIPWHFPGLPPISNVMPTILKGNEVVLSWIETTAASSIWQWFNLSLDKTLLSLWLVGALVLGAYILIRNIKFLSLVNKGKMVTDSGTLDLLEKCKERLSINNTLNIIVIKEIKSPALFGYFRPRLLLPEGIFNHFSNNEMYYVFMHELGHLKRHDIAVSCFVTFIQVIHWFNPLVWLAFYQMRIDQESACDALVLSRLRPHQSVEYANAIVGFLERYCRNRQLPSMACILENKTQMKRRLTMIINYKKYSKKMKVMAVALLLAAGLISFTISGFAQQDSKNVTTSNAGNMIKDAEFPGGMNALLNWLKSNLQYPEEAQRAGIQGVVAVQFTIGIDGKISDVTIAQGVNESLDAEALRLVRSMPDWMPGERNGTKFKTAYTMPVRFVLQPPTVSKDNR
jgi:TonB family protein